MDPPAPPVAPTTSVSLNPPPEDSETSGMTDPFKDYSVAKDRPFGKFSVALSYLPFAVQFFHYVSYACVVFHHMPLWKAIRNYPLLGNVSLNNVMRDKDIDPLAFLWVVMYYIKADFYKDININKGILDFLREFVEPHMLTMEPALRQQLYWCLNPPPDVPGTSPPLGMQQTDTGMASAMSGPSLGTPYGMPSIYPVNPQVQQTPAPSAAQATLPPFQTSGLPRTFGTAPHAAPTPAAAPPAASPATSTISAPSAVTLSAGAGPSTLSPGAGPSNIASPQVSTVSSQPLTSIEM